MRVVIADDHYLVREGIRRLLEESGAVDVLATVADGEQLRDAVARLRPDVVVVDIRMPPGHRMEGIEAAHRIRAEHPGTGVVVLSQYANPLYAFELFKDGTAGLAYLLKDRIGELDELLRALRGVVAGGSVIDPLVVEDLLRRQPRTPPRADQTLTARERQVLAAMAEGHSNSAIATTLSISPSGVENNINSIFAKLGLAPDDTATHRRVAAVITYLRDAAQLRP